MAVLHVCMRISILLVIVNLHRKTCMGEVDDSHKISKVITAVRGETKTLKCFYPEKHRLDVLYWYKQMAGCKPSPLVMWQLYTPLPKFYDDFKDSRFNITKQDLGFHLIISNTKTSDEALYLCGINNGFDLHFVVGTFLSVKGKNQQSSDSAKLIQFPVLKKLYQGDSVVINCTLVTETSAEDIRVFWFKAAEDETHPGVIYTSMNRSSYCERSCHYSLARTNLSLTDNGTYHCAVSTCGKILFGNGTILHIRKTANPLIFGLSAVGMCVNVIGVLIYTNCKKAICQHNKGSPPETCGDEGIHGDMVNYAAVNFSDTRTSRERNKRELQQDTLYTEVIFPAR